ncbi:MAG: aminotransferase class V-fold PLP-dependent enzyme [Halobacteriovoraceae bacterium]|nr:aminotransferase class V-fold PLP-dependent enzyme [Halobacteriovoraceae bacterium]
MIYLDHAAATPILPEALEIYCKSLNLDFANPAAKHCLGKNLLKKCDTVRNQFKKTISAGQGEIIFTSSATESNNFIFSQKHLSKACILRGDHPGTLKAARHWFDELIEIVSWSNHQEIINSVVEKGPDIFTICHVDGQSGYLYNIEQISKGIKDKLPHCHIHVDAVQSFCKYDINLRKMNIDSLCVSGHKIGAPKGISSLWLKNPDKFHPFIYGGGQENGLRSSTINAPLIFSFSKTCDVAKNLYAKHFNRITELNSLMRENIQQAIFPYKLEETSPFILMLILPMVSSDLLLRHLEQKEIFVSSTSACSSRIKGDNEIFHFYKIESKFHKNVLRVSLSHQTTTQEVETFISELNQIYCELKNLAQKRN